MSNAEVAKFAGVHSRTFNGWRREEYLMPFVVATKLADEANITLPKNAKLEDRYWYTRVGAKAGWEVVKDKYGRVPVNEEYRQRKWREWWEKTGKHTAHKIINRPKSFKKPRLSRDLAEFVGIMIGDGGMSERQLNITLHHIDDYAYGQYVRGLLKKLFRVPVAFHERKERSTINVVISRTALVVFCHDTLGLKVGDKIRQRVDIPDWVMNSQACRESCVRGLWDTDGCIFNECHGIKGKKYCYPRMSFVSASPRLCKSVMRILSTSGFSPVMRGSRKVQLERRQDIIDYFRKIGTNNPKHRKRAKEFLGGVG